MISDVFSNLTSLLIDDYGCIFEIELVYLLKIISDVFFNLISMLLKIISDVYWNADCFRLKNASTGVCATRTVATLWHLPLIDVLL